MNYQRFTRISRRTETMLLWLLAAAAVVILAWLV